MSESALITLEIGGDSSGAVEAANAVAEALSHIGASAEGAQGASGGIEQVGAATRSAGGEAQQASGEFEGMGSSLTAVVGAALGVSSATGPLKESLSAAGEGAAALGEGMGGLGAAAAAGIGGLAALGGAGAEWANETMRMSSIMGLSQEETEQWAHAIDIAGGSGEQFSAAVRRIQVAMDSGSSSKYAKDFAELHVEMDGTAGEVLTRVIPALAAMTDTKERDRIGTELMSRGYMNLKPLIENYSEVSELATGITEKHSGQMGNATQSAIRYNAATESLKATTEEIGVKALPLLVNGLSVVGAALDVAGVPMGVVNSGLDLIGVGAPSAGVGMLGMAVAGAAVGSAFGPIGTVVGGLIGGFAGLAGAAGGAGESSGAAATQMVTLADGSEVTKQSVYDAAASLSAYAATGGEGSQAAGEMASALMSTGESAGTAAGRVSEMASASQELVNSQASAQAALNGTGDVFANVWGNIMRAADALGSYSDAAGSLNQATVPGNWGQPTGMATGGGVTGGQLYQVNEMGREYFRPNSDGTIIPSGSYAGGAPSSGGGGGNTVIYNQNGPVYGTEDLKRQVLDFVREASLHGLLRDYVEVH